MPRSALALTALAAVLVALALVLGGLGDDTTAYTLRLQNAGQLVRDNDVQVGGRRIGRVAEIRLGDDGMAELRLEVDEPIAPLHAGTTATVRATSLSGVANRYVALAPGPNSAPELRAGSTLPAGATTSIVDLDQLFNTLDPEARKGLSRVVRGLGTWYDGRGDEGNEAAEVLAPALQSTRRLVAELGRDEAVLRGLLESSSRTSRTLARRGDQVTSLVADAGTTATAIAREREALAQALRALPETLRSGRATFAELRPALDDLDALVEAGEPVARDLPRFFEELRPVVDTGQPAIADLRRLVRSPGRGDDLLELLRQAPALARATTRASDEGVAALRRSIPLLSFARPYAPDLVGLLRDFGGSASNYDANGHFARVQPVFGAFRVEEGDGGPRLVPQDAARRLDGLVTGQLRRCPGAATQRAADGSNVFRDTDGTLDCDPAAVPPGP